MITAKEAAQVANEHGLSLSDAVALQRLSNTTAEAEALAGQFTGAPQPPPPVDPNSLTPLLAEKAARKQAELARCWKYNQQYEDSLRLRARDKAAWDALPADHRSCVGYYEPTRTAAKAAGIDVTKGGSQ